MCPNELPYSTPEEQKVSSQAIEYFLDGIEENDLELHSFILLKNGYVISDAWWYPYQKENSHMLFSLTKSFTAMAVGFAESEGLLSIDDHVISFFSEMPEMVNKGYEELTIRHLLTMSVGHEKPTMGSELRQIAGSWIKHYLQLPIINTSGSQFQYDTGASHILSAIIQKVSGVSLVDYLYPRLLEPLGITYPKWDSAPEGNTVGGAGLSLRTIDLAKFGQFLLQKGMWNGKRLLSESWINDATSFQIITGEDQVENCQQGYGYQFWLCKHESFRAEGSFSQLVIIMPEKNTVVAITGGESNSNSVLELIWDRLLPGIEPKTPLLQDEYSSNLKKKLAQLQLKYSSNLLKSSPLIPEITGKVYKMMENEFHISQVSIEFGENCCTFIMKDNRGVHKIICGFHTWIEGNTAMSGSEFHLHYQPVELKVFARAGWRNEKELEMIWCFGETPYVDSVILSFEDLNISMVRSVNTDTNLSRIVATGIANHSN